MMFPITLSANDPVVKLLTNTGHQPRGWWDRPAAGLCRGLDRQHRGAYAMRRDTLTLHDGNKVPVRVASDGAIYFPTQHRGWKRLNPTRNKHQRRAQAAANTNAAQ